MYSGFSPSLEALSQLHLFELLLLQNEAELGHEDTEGEGRVKFNAADVLEDNILLLLSEATNVRVRGELLVLHDDIAFLHNQSGPGQHLLTRRVSIRRGHSNRLGASSG